jgi:hypothetical protein
MSGLSGIEARAKQVLSAGGGRRAPIHQLLGDDSFCALMMRHRAEQGVQLPDQDGALPASARLAFLHALANDEGVAEAREGCDGRRGLLARLARAREMVDSQEFSGASDAPSIREMLISSLTAMLERENPNSHWAAQYLLYGSGRIPQVAIPLHERDTPPETAVRIIRGLLAQRPERLITISDRDPVTDSVGFIRIGERPAHFGFPETGSPKTGTNAAVLHYEIDHPGGPFCLFTDAGGPIGERMIEIQEACPLYINDPHQLMALNTYWLREIGVFCAPCGDTQITFLDRDGVISASEYPDFSADAGRIMAELGARGLEREKLDSLAPFLRGEKGVPDHDWDLIDQVSESHPDLMGHLGMAIDRSHIFGVPRARLETLARDLCGPDLAGAAVDAALTGAVTLDLPAGPLHLYVPNIATTSRSQDAEPLLNTVTGRRDRKLMFLLADRPLDLGPDPHSVTTMRRVPVVGPEAGPEPG